MPSSSVYIASRGHEATHGASSQCLQTIGMALEISSSSYRSAGVSMWPK
jgi:hypothetical protein